MKKKIYIRITALFCAVFTVLSLVGCAASYKENTSFAMGSILTAKIYAPEETANVLFTNINDRIANADKCISAIDPTSEIYRINKDGSGKVSAYTVSVLENAITICNLFDKSIDITIGAVSELWGFSTDEPTLPADDDIKAALETVDLSRITVNEEKLSVTLGEGQHIDLGAFGKGAALDEAYCELQTGNSSAVITLGGSVLLYGKAPKKNGWSTGITDPYGDGATPFAGFSVKLGDGEAAFISTSGSYNKAIYVNDEAYHHILSPKTGYPCETEILSVTVLAQSGLMSDALSTACFINGLNDYTLQKLKSFGAEAVFLLTDCTYYVTDGLKDTFELYVTNYTEKQYES